MGENTLNSFWSQWKSGNSKPKKILRDKQKSLGDWYLLVTQQENCRTALPPSDHLLNYKGAFW